MNAEAETLRTSLRDYLEFLAKTPVDEMSPDDVQEVRDTLDEIRATEQFLEEVKARRKQ